jgi:hypothetical protein
MNPIHHVEPVKVIADYNRMYAKIYDGRKKWKEMGTVTIQFKTLADQCALLMSAAGRS